MLSFQATVVYDSCLPKLAGRLTPEILDGLDARRRRLLVTVGYIQVLLPPLLPLFSPSTLSFFLTHHVTYIFFNLL